MSKKRKLKVALITLLMVVLLNQATARPAIYALVSFSMPKMLLEQTLSDCVRLNIPAYLNGLYHNSMKETAVKVLELSQKIPDLNLQIDPTAFERFAIHQVPALVVENHKAFDVIYGNLPLDEGLARIADSGDSGLTRDDVRRLSGG